MIITIIIVIIIIIYDILGFEPATLTSAAPLQAPLQLLYHTIPYYTIPYHTILYYTRQDKTRLD